MHRPLEPEVFALLRDLHEHAPRLARLLIFVEPTKTICSAWVGTHATQKLTRKLACGGLASHETDISGKEKPIGFSLHCSREIPGWQAFEQGGISPDATTSLSD
jgi:hypothetical protein